MNWAERHIQQIETPKTKAKEYIEWGLKLLFTATGITVAFGLTVLSFLEREVPAFLRLFMFLTKDMGSPVFARPITSGQF